MTEKKTEKTTRKPNLAELKERRSKVNQEIIAAKKEGKSIKGLAIKRGKLEQQIQAMQEDK